MKQGMQIAYGPLAGLIGRWEGNKGVDIAPEPDGEEENLYYESLIFSELGDVLNAGSQKLAVLRYQQIVRHQANDNIFHDETGYWIWDADRETIMHSFVIPRAVSVLAGGLWKQTAEQQNEIVIEVAARAGDADWGIIQSPFMRDNAQTVEFSRQLKIAKDKLRYQQTTVLEIYGRRFNHTDQNELIRC